MVASPEIDAGIGTQSCVIGPGAIRERSETLGRVEAASGVKERTKTGGRVVVPGVTAKERINTIGRVEAAGCVA